MFLDINTNTDFGKSNNALLFLYPNPAHNYIYIIDEEYSDSECDYKVFDLQGRIILYGTKKADQPALDISEIPNGTYILSFATDHKQSKHAMIIKQ